MSQQPTRGAEQRTDNTQWSNRPTLARIVRITLFLLPFIAGWLAVRYTKAWYWQPEGLSGTVLWITQAIIVAIAASHLATRLAQRFTPLTALLKMTLVFPDRAPSRFGLALRAGTVGQLRKQEIALTGDVQQAAEQAIDLVMQLGKHERSTRGHTERVRAYADLLGQELGLSEVELNKLRWGVLLHDVGKLAVPANILNKEGSPTEEEWAILKRHPAEGAKILGPLAPWLGDWSLAASQHHERWDGAGYPAGLSGTEISLAGRIASVADAFDVITSKRSYKTALSIETAREELVACSGTQFDPQIVRAFLKVGMHRRQTAGKLSWIVELPSVIRVTSNVATAPIAAAATVISATAMVGSLAPAPPAAMAFADTAAPLSVTLESTTSTSLASSTTSSPASTNVAPTEPPAEPSTTALDESTTSTTLATTASSAATSTTSAPTTASSSPTTEPPSTVASTTTTQSAASAPPTTPATTPPTTAAPTTGAPTTTTTAAPTTTTTAPTTTTTAPTTTTTAPPSSPTGTGFALLTAGDLPGSLSEGNLTGTDVFVFEEQNGLRLGSPLTVRSFEQGNTIDGNSTATTTLAAGTSICVWFVHADPNQITHLDATIDFNRQVLGFALNIDDLNDTDQFALPGINYDYQDLGSPDTVTTTGSQVVFHADYRFRDVDQMRVITAC